MISRRAYLIVFILTQLAQVHAQISLKKFDNPKLSGLIESIMFQDTVSGIRSNEADNQSGNWEFNIQENNPYNTLRYEVIGTRSTGANIYKLSKAQASEFFKMDIDEFQDSIITSSHYYAKSYENFALIAYNLLGYYEQAEASEKTRKASIKILNKYGDIIYNKELNSDCYSPELSPDGKFISYSYGESTHDISSSEYGIKIINIINYTDVADIKAHINNSYTKYNFLIFRGTGDTGWCTWIFDFTKSELYKLVGIFYTNSSTSFKLDDKSLIISDLSPYKIN